MEMNDFSEKVSKYLWILIAISIGMFILSFISPFTLKNFADRQPSAADFDTLFFLLMAARTLIGLIFGLILYLDCRKEIKNKYLIPLLGVAAPIVGTMFYFIEKYLATKTQYHDN